MIVVSRPPASDGHHHHPADVPSLLLTEEERKRRDSGTFLGREPQADIVGGPVAFAVAQGGTQSIPYFGDVGGAVGDGQGRDEAFGKGFKPSGNVSRQRGRAGDQGNVAAGETRVCQALRVVFDSGEK